MSTRPLRVAQRVLPLISLAVLSCVCLPCTWHRPCQVPGRLARQDVIGQWQLSYGPEYGVSDPIEGTLTVTDTTAYLIRPDLEPLALTECDWLVGYDGNVSRPDVAWERCPQLRGHDYFLTGTEMLELHEDGTFVHSFQSEDYEYISQGQRWEYISETESPDGPKLKMPGMKYFAEGVAQANSSATITLKAQVTDLLRIQEYMRTADTRPPDVESGVAYPDFGHIYLYPRLCRGDLALNQMGFRVGDPDNLVVRSPPFQRP